MRAGLALLLVALSAAPLAAQPRPHTQASERTRKARSAAARRPAARPRPLAFIVVAQTSGPSDDEPGSVIAKWLTTAKPPEIDSVLMDWKPLQGAWAACKRIVRAKVARECDVVTLRQRPQRSNPAALEVVLTFTQYRPDSTGHEDQRPVPAQLCGNSPEAPQWINCRYLLKMRLGQAMRDHVTFHHLPPPPGE